jgi:SsrA-binding protein
MSTVNESASDCYKPLVHSKDCVCCKGRRRGRPGRWVVCAVSTLSVLWKANISNGFPVSSRALIAPRHQHQWLGRSITSPTALFAKSGTKKKKTPDRTVAVNRIAYRNYEIIDTLEAGISLLGTEVKSIREGKLNLRDGYVKPSKNGRSCVLHNVHVAKCQYVGAEYFQHEEKRPRALLIHSSQARKFLQQTEQQGMTVIPLKAYWNEGNKLKIEIALCRGKNVRDKRATIQAREVQRETNRIIKNFRL